MRIVRIHARISDWRRLKLDRKLRTDDSTKTPELVYELNMLLVSERKMPLGMKARSHDA
jgi:hypothetical protein